MSGPSLQNLEEAASVAAEFISSLDNLPYEVQHVLQEIRLKETKCQELQQEITKDQARYIKSSLRLGSSIPLSPAIPGTAPNGIDGIAQTPTQNGSAPKAHLPARIAAAYAEIDTLSSEKILLAEQLISLLTRTRARLDADLSRVRVLQGESPEEVARTASATHAHPLMTAVSSNSSSTPSPFVTRRFDATLGISANPVLQIGEALRGALAAPADSMLVSLTPAAPSASINKKRRITTTTSIKLPSPAPMLPLSSIGGSSGAYSRSRLSRQAHPKHLEEEEDLDADAEGEEDVEGEDAEEDSTPYCFCRKQSYGDMIGCDNPDCPYQWFHISCVGVKTPLPDKWYCPECKGKSAPERRKGRKK